MNDPIRQNLDDFSQDFSKFRRKILKAAKEETGPRAPYELSPVRVDKAGLHSLLHVSNSALALLRTRARGLNVNAAHERRCRIHRCWLVGALPKTTLQEPSFLHLQQPNSFSGLPVSRVGMVGLRAELRMLFQLRPQSGVAKSVLLPLSIYWLRFQKVL